MQREEFDKILEKLLAHCTATLKSKAKEYAPSPDRLHNFKATAYMNKETPVQACWGMASKHIISIADMVRENHELHHPMPVWDEKIGDALNYLILLYACVKEQEV